jgi:hypothetical protein
MPYWICDSCGTRVYSASKRLEWRECPVCPGTFELEGQQPAGINPQGDAVTAARHEPGHPGSPRRR